jgi:hypothetical protein
MNKRSRGIDVCNNGLRRIFLIGAIAIATTVVVGGGAYVRVQQVFGYILVVILTGGENQSTRSKNTDQPTYSQQAYHLQFYRVF